MLNKCPASISSFVSTWACRPYECDSVSVFSCWWTLVILHKPDVSPWVRTMWRYQRSHSCREELWCIQENMDQSKHGKALKVIRLISQKELNSNPKLLKPQKVELSWEIFPRSHCYINPGISLMPVSAIHIKGWSHCAINSSRERGLCL